MRTCVIFNPAAKGDKARRSREFIAQVSSGCTLKPTTGPGTGRPLAAEAVRQGFERIIAAGGDGTLNEIVNGIADEPDGLTRVVLGVLPVGTANVFARELRVPFPLKAAWQVATGSHLETVDLFQVDCHQGDRLIRRYGLQLAGAGLDARATELVSWKWKKRQGFLAYIGAAIRALRESQPRITIVDADRTESGQLVLIGNGRLYGGPFPLFPRADLHDGRLEIRIVGRVSYWTALACGLGVLTGRTGLGLPSRDFQAEALELQADRRTALQIDGEPVGELPARIVVLPGRLRVVVP